MLDRIDIHIEVPQVDYEKLSDDRLGEPSANVQARVEVARQIQRERFGVRATHEPPQQITCNADNARPKSGSTANLMRPAIP